MRFVIHCLDQPGNAALRLAHYEAHKAYLASTTVHTVVSGPLVADDGVSMIGSMFIVDAASRAAVEAFHAADPFRTTGVWGEARIQAFLMRVDNRS
jgi:uncharacterized protein YciI